MQTASRRRTTWAIVASLIAHAAVLGVAAVQRPTLVIPIESGGPPEAIIPILLLPHAPPPAAGSQAPSEIHLHQRALRFTPAELPVAPLPVPLIPPTTPATPATPPGPVTVTANPAAEIQRGEVRAALQGLIGCRDPDAARLTVAQRAKCDERLAAGAKEAPFLGSGASAEKRGLLDKAAADKDAYNRYRRAAVIPERAGGDLGDGSAHDLARALGNDRPEATAKLPR